MSIRCRPRQPVTQPVLPDLLQHYTKRPRGCAHGLAGIRAVGLARRRGPRSAMLRRCFPRQARPRRRLATLSAAKGQGWPSRLRVPQLSHPLSFRIAITDQRICVLRKAVDGRSGQTAYAIPRTTAQSRCLNSSPQETRWSRPRSDSHRAAKHPGSRDASPLTARLIRFALRKRLRHRLACTHQSPPRQQLR